MNGQNNMKMNWYNTATHFYNQELSLIGQRNMAFLIVQSILIAAFATMLVNASKVQWSLIIFMSGISIAGALFCLVHYQAGRAGAQGAFYWRRYMLSIETGQPEAPWSKRYEYSSEKHNIHLDPPAKKCFCLWVNNLLSRLQCDRCLLDRLPLPSAWLTTPVIFSMAWSISSVYLTVRLFISGDPLRMNPFLNLALSQAISILISLSAFCILCYIICRCIKWWGNHES